MGKVPVENSNCEDMFIYKLKCKMFQRKTAYEGICSLSLPQENSSKDIVEQLSRTIKAIAILSVYRKASLF